MFGRLGGAEPVVLIPVLLFAVSVCIPAAVIARRIGRSPWLGLLAVVPLVNVILLWVVAFAPWNVDGRGTHDRVTNAS